jgi:predicted exporter
MTCQPTALLAGLLIVWTAMSLLAEWQARRALVALVSVASARLVTIHQNALSGLPFGLLWEAGSDQRTRQTGT